MENLQYDGSTKGTTITLMKYDRQEKALFHSVGESALFRSWIKVKRAEL